MDEQAKEVGAKFAADHCGKHRVAIYLPGAPWKGLKTPSRVFPLTRK